MKSNMLIEMLKGRRIAIVGNSAVDKDYSAEIDAADIVCRFNHFYNYNSGRVGKRVDIIFQTFAKPWYDLPRDGANGDVIQSEKPVIFVAKKPEQYVAAAREWLGPSIRVEYMVGLEPYCKYTTGGAVLAYLADHLDNAEVKVYGFAGGEEWAKYIAGDAKAYASIADEERFVVDGAIARLARLTCKPAESSVPHIVIPVKKTSKGAPGKNKKLLPVLLEKLKAMPCVNPVTIVTDDETIKAEDGVNVYLTPRVPTLMDVTSHLRMWRDGTNYVGDIILLQCTSPHFDVRHISRMYELRGKSNIVATATELPMKVNNVFITAPNGLNQRLSRISPSVPRQLLPKAWYINGAAYILHSDYLSRDSFFNGCEVTPYIVDASESLDVDTVADLAKV